MSIRSRRESSGNVFADLGLPHADERRAKADLAFRISEAIRTRRLTQAAAAKLFEVDQPKIADKRQIPEAEAVCAIDGSPMLRGSGLVITKSP